MNSTPRTATRGGNKKADSGVKGHKSDGKKDGSKNNDAKKAHPSSERIAKITEPTTDHNSLKKKVEMVMDVIDTSEDAAFTALHDCDGNVDAAVSMLLEGGTEGQWETSGKKKKNKQPVPAKGEGVPGELDDSDSQPLSSNLERDRSRGRGGGAPRGRGRGAGDRGPGRNRDNKENEGGSGDDGFRSQRGDRGDGFRREGRGRGMSNGPGGRPGRGGRGGGGRLGSRPYGSRDGERRDRDAPRFQSTIDTWNPSGAQEKTEPLKMETWGDNFPAPEDWDNEEYTGSLADTKVFTPSAVESQAAAAAAAAAGDPSADPAAQDLLSMTAVQSQDYQQAAAMPPSPLPVGVGALSTAQAQYLTQLTQQSAENKAAAAAASAYGQSESLKSAVGIGGSAGTYAQSASYAPASSYGQSNYVPSSYGAAAAPYQSSAGYAPTSVAVTNAFSSVTSAQSNAYSGAPTNTPYSTSTSGSGPYPASMQGYPAAANTSYGAYSSATSANVSYNNYAAQSAAFEPANADLNATSAQPQRVKTQRPRVPPPSKIPSSAVEMPEDQSVGMVSLQFGGLEFGSDGTSLDEVAGTDSNPMGTDASTAAVLDASSASQNSLSAYTNKNSVNSQQASLVGGLTGKVLSNSDGLGMSTASDHKTSYNSQTTRAAISTAGLDLSKSDVTNLSYAAAPTSANSYTGYPAQKSAAYQPAAYSAAYTATQTTYSGVAPSSYATSYSSQQSANSFPTSYGSQPSNASTYPASGATYPSTNSFPNASQNYQSSSVYGTYPTGYQNSYSTSTTNAKLNSGLSTTKENDFTSTSTSNLSSSSVSGTVTSTTTSGTTLASSSAPATATSTSSSKISAGAMKGSVVPSLHPQMLSTPQYIMSGTGMPFYHQTPMYGYEDVQLHQLQRIPHMPTQYYDVGYTAPTSLAAGRDTLPNAFTMGDARYSTRADNSASPVPSTLSQQTATGAHQQPMMNHPSLPPGYTYVYNTVPGSFQYSPIFPMQSAGNAHATTSNQFAKPASYGSTYGSGYETLGQDYTKSPYVSSGVGVKSTVGVGGVTVTSSTSSADLYGKPHAALGKVNSYDKQGFHSATPPPFNLAAGQGTGMTASGAYPPQQVYIPAMPHQQHHNLIPSHLQDLTSNSGQRTQAAPQAGKSGNKPSYTPYWSAN